jgi:hypothetical protein
MAFAGALAVATVTFAAPPAQAQGGQSGAVAEALYQDGVKLMKDGKTHEACIKFGESQRADASTGTLINLATCHEKEGKTATAWAEFSDAAAQAARSGQKDRESYARDHAAALEKQLHRLVLELASPDKGTEVKLDGEALGSGALGTAIPVDPGEHDLQVTAPGKKPWTQKLQTVAGAATERVAVPALETDPNAVLAADGTLVGGGGQRGSDTRADSGETITPGNPTKKIVGFGLIGVGALGLGFGTYYLVRSIQLEKDANAKDATTGQPLHGNHDDLLSQAKLARTLTIVTGATGVVAAGVGIYLVATSGPTITTKGVSAARGVRLVPSGDVSSARLDLLGVW